MAMNLSRRRFLKGLGAAVSLSLVPSIPLPAIASVCPVIEAASAVTKVNLNNNDFTLLEGCEQNLIDGSSFTFEKLQDAVNRAMKNSGYDSPNILNYITSYDEYV